MGKMNSATLRLVLLISCGHALVHIYEPSFGSVEQLVVADARFGIAAGAQKQVSGQLGNAMRLPFGLCALAAGWLADRYGARRLLLVYLFGCSGAAVSGLVSAEPAAALRGHVRDGDVCQHLSSAGRGADLHHTTPENRTMALGYHGIFGSAGIAAGPFLAGLVLNMGASWGQYYLVLSVPGVLLALLSDVAI